MFPSLWTRTISSVESARARGDGTKAAGKKVVIRVSMNLKDTQYNDKYVIINSSSGAVIAGLQLPYSFLLSLFSGICTLLLASGFCLSPFLAVLRLLRWTKAMVALSCLSFRTGLM